MPPQAQGAYNAVKQALSIFSPFNKVAGPTEDTGQPDIAEEYRSKMSDEDIIALTGQWIRDYATYYAPISKVQKESYEYWIGKQTKNTVEDMMEANRSMVDNRVFYALETLIPMATRANPDPLCSIDPTLSDQQLAELTENFVTYQADRQKLRMLIKGAVRDWALSLIGCFKVSWDPIKDDIRTEVVNPLRLILDPNGYIAEGGIFTGEYIGERKKLSVAKLIQMFPSHQEWLMAKGGGKKGTKLEITEWWYLGRDYFFTYENKVLGKFKNHLWNYDSTDPLTGLPIGGENHMDEPMAPYVFLGIYTTRQNPHDDTSLIHQIIPLQDLVNRRFRQIDKNAESTNNGIVVNKDFNSEQAALASEAIRKGGAIRALTDDVTKAVMRLPAPNLAPVVKENMDDARQEIDNIFGISGSTAPGIAKEETVRGKIEANQMDSSRVGGGITEYIEQAVDTLYNWWVQIAYVYYDAPHYASALGTQGAQQLMQLKNTDLRGKIVITVKEGSLIPKDPLTKRNEAIDLWSANAIDPISLYQKLDYPDPFSAAENLLKWQMIQKGLLPPQLMFPDFPQAPLPVQPQVAQGNPEQPGTGGPAVNPIGGGEQNAPPEMASPSAVTQQSQKLMRSVPI